MNIRYGLLVGGLTAMLGCGDDAESVTLEPVEIRFSAVDATGEAFSCGRDDLRIAGLQDAQPGDLRLYVHDVHLLDSEGNRVEVALEDDDIWQHVEGDDHVALLDFEDGTAACEEVIFGKVKTSETRNFVRGTPAQPGPYSGVGFRVGVPAALNHTETAPAPAPLNSTGMDHGPADGRQFVRFAFYSETLGAPAEGAYNLYILRSVCNNVTADGGVPASPDDCAKNNRPEVTLGGAGSTFDPTSDEVIIDVDALVDAYTVPGSTGGPHPDLNPDGRIDCFSPLHAGDWAPPMAPVTFSGAARCGTAYPALGLDYDTGAVVGTQRVFWLGQ